MEDCYEFFSCVQFECERHKHKERECWLIEGDYCTTHTEAMIWLREDVGNKSEACKFCLYYQFRHN